jgi:hypothetical protein
MPLISKKQLDTQYCLIFRAENRLTVGFQAPTVSRKKDMRHTHPIWERGAESGVRGNVMFLGLL